MSFKLHYGWIIVLLSVLLYLFGGTLNQAFGALINPLEQKYGWRHSAILAAYGISAVAGALLSPYVGMLNDRYGGKFLIFISIVSFLIGAIITALATDVWHIWVSFGIFMGITHACLNISLITTISYWFDKQLGVAVGIVQAAQGFGPGITTLFLTSVLPILGVQNTFWFISIGGSIAMFFLLIFYRSTPQSYGMTPYGSSEAFNEQPSKNEPLEKLRQQVHAKAVQGTSEFWKLVVVHHLGCVSHAVMMMQFIPIAVTAGVSYSTAGIAASMFFSISSITRFITPAIAERLGARNTMFVMFLWQAIPIFFLIWSDASWHFYLFSVIWGLGYGGEGSAFAVINRQYYGRGSFGRSYGWQIMGAGLGMAVGGYIGGPLYDLTGSHTLTICFSGGASLLGALIIFSMSSTKEILIPNWEANLPKNLET